MYNVFKRIELVVVPRTYEIVSFSRSELWSVGHGAELYDAERRLALVMRLTTVDDEKGLQVSLVGVVQNAVLVVVCRYLNSSWISTESDVDIGARPQVNTGQHAGSCIQTTKQYSTQCW